MNERENDSLNTYPPKKKQRIQNTIQILFFTENFFQMR